MYHEPYVLRFAPLVWTGLVNPSPAPSPFKATWSDTCTVLSDELRHLKAERSSVILMVDAAPSQIRKDGQIAANARVDGRAVILSFTGRYGPMSYPCDAYETQSWRRAPSWQHNARAIALGLKALRTVDRYGIADRGQQYAGYAALDPGTPMGPVMTQMTAEQAVDLLIAESGVGAGIRPYLLADDENEIQTVYRLACKKSHPDAGGTADRFQRVRQAYDVLLQS